MAASKIEWTGRVWNPLAGCSVLSPGCTHCYAMRMAARIVRMGHTRAYDITKRSERLARLAPDLPWPSNLWIGVSVEDRKRLARIDHLRTLPAAVRWLSIEPLLENLGCLDLAGIGWVVVGGESGPGARAMAPGWAMDIRDQCVAAGVPFFFKQHDGVHKKKAGRLLDGREWSQYPPNQ